MENMDRKPVSKGSMNTAFDMVRSNMARAIEKHGGSAHAGAHEALGILTEDAPVMSPSARCRHEPALRGDNERND